MAFFCVCCLFLVLVTGILLKKSLEGIFVIFKLKGKSQSLKTSKRKASYRQVTQVTFMHWFQKKGLPLPTKFLLWRKKKDKQLGTSWKLWVFVGYDCHLLYPTKWPYTPYLPEPNRCPGCCVAQAVLQGHQLFPLANPTPRQLDLNYSCSGQEFIKLQISPDVL